MTIFQNWRPYTVRGAAANVHIELDDTKLWFYVPKDKKTRKLCYLNQLPKRLVVLLGIADPTALRVVGSIIAASSDLLDDLLTEEGIIHVPGVEPSRIEAPTNTPDDEVDHSGPTTSEVTLVPSGSRRQKTPEPTFSVTRLRSAFAKTARGHGKSPDTKIASSSPATPAHVRSVDISSAIQLTFSPKWTKSTPELIVSNNDAYQALFDCVINTTRCVEIPEFVDPSERMRDSNTPTQIIKSSTLFGHAPKRKQARIGASAEPYVSWLSFPRRHITDLVDSSHLGYLESNC